MRQGAPEPLNERSARESAERCIVGAISSCPDKQADIFSNFDDPKIFDNEHYADIFSAALDVHRAGGVADFTTIQHRLEETLGYIPDWFMAVWMECDQDAGILPSLIHGWKCVIVKDEQFNRFKRDALHARTLEDVERVAADALRRHPLIGGDDEPNTAEACKRFLERMDAIRSGKIKAGHSWGVDTLDDAMLLRAGHSYCVSGLKKAGKSQLVIHTVAANVLAGNPSMIFSLEMSTDSILTHLAAMGAKLNSRRILAMNTDEEAEQIRVAINAVAEWPLQINQNPSITVGEIFARASGWKRENHIPDGAGLVAVDFLQLVKYDTTRGASVNEAAQIKQVAYDLARMAKELRMAVLSVAQFNNSGEGQVPSMRYIEGSGGIMQSVEGAVLLNNLARTKDVPVEGQWAAIDAIVHQRSGESGLTVRLEADLSTNIFRSAGYAKDYS